MMTLNELAMLAHNHIFYYTPYRTGNLTRSIGDVFGFGNQAGFKIFDATQRAGYGAILNEAPVISYRVRNPYTGAEYTGTYNNIHYKWIDRWAETFANELSTYIPVTRR